MPRRSAIYVVYENESVSYLRRELGEDSMSAGTNPDTVERFFRAMLDAKRCWPHWIKGLERPHPGEARTETHAVAITPLGRMCIHFEDVPGGIERFNWEYPKNATLVILIYPGYSDSRIADKSLQFLDREWRKVRSRRRR